jgi:hypothetical protein
VGEATRAQAAHLPPTSAEVNKTWIYTCTPPCVFIAQCLVKLRNNFTFYFFSYLRSGAISMADSIVFLQQLIDLYCKNLSALTYTVQNKQLLVHMFTLYCFMTYYISL